MASSHRKKGRAARVIVVCVLLILVAAALTFYFLADRSVKALQQGATFDFTYQITSTDDQPTTLYTILQRVGATDGTVSGQYAPAKLQLALSDTSGVPFTHLYIDSSETLYDVGQLYSYLRTRITAAYPLAESLLPQWNLGDYISQTQLASVLGVELNTTELQDMTNFTLALAALKPVRPEGALDGYTYFQLDGGTASPTLILGLPLKNLFSRSRPLHVLLTIPDHAVAVQLTGTLSAADTTVLAPTSRMAEDDIARFTQIRETVESFLAFLQQLSSETAASSAASSSAA